MKNQFLNCRDPQDMDECGNSTSKTAFLHHVPHAYGILVMELGSGDQVRIMAGLLRSQY